MKTVIALIWSLFTAACYGQDTSGLDGTPKIDLAEGKHLYVVGYAHLDTQWRWTYPYVIQNFVRNTMEQNFPLFEKYPHYIFNFTGSRRYEFMKEYYPGEYETVKKYVAQGRWFPAGSSVDENDANIPSLESFVRQSLYGNHFFQREFGIHSEEYMLPDCFGFPASLPTIFTHNGVKAFSTQKLTWGSAVGIPFNVGTWTGPDGSIILAALNPGSYGATVDDDLSKSEMWQQRLEADGEKSGLFVDYKYYGTGDRGGAPSDSSVQWIEKSQTSGGSIHVVSSRADQMFKDITPDQASKLPNYKGELLLVNHSAGSLTSQAYMKRWNRQNEQLASAAETASAAAFWLKALPYPSDTLYRGWDLVLGSQMHDIMPGTSLPKAYECSWNDEVLALNQFAGVTERSSSAILAQLNTQVKGTPVAVYNPLSIAREDLIEASIPFSGSKPDAFTAYGPEGQPVPTQILDYGANAVRVLFLARAPSMGYAIYDLRPEKSTSSPSLVATANSLENAHYRVTLNSDGDIQSIFDKVLNHELLSSPARLSFHTENPAQFPAWNMDWDDRKKPARAYVGGPATIRVLESGPARVALEVRRTAENGVFTQRVSLGAGASGERVEVSNHIDWRSFAASLKADFPLAANNPNATYDDKVGVVQRDNDSPTRFEVPFQQWMDLTDGDSSYGVEIMSDSKYAADKPDDHTLRLTLLYTPGTRGGYRDQGTQDQGRHDILYAVASHKGDWAQGQDCWQAARVNQPLRSFVCTPHAGPLGSSFSFLSVNSGQVQVMGLKKAEDSDEIVVRLRELSGQAAQGVVLSFPTKIIGAREVDGQENDMGVVPIENGKLVVDMKSFGLRAFAIKLEAAPVQASPITSHPVTLDYDTDVVSSRSLRTDGAMDEKGGTYPAEMFPQQLMNAGVKFQLGPVSDGQKNAIAAHGQQITLPPGNFNHVYILAASDGDMDAQIRIGSQSQSFVVPNWTGYVGQWDDRIWDKPIEELDYNPGEKVVGLIPGYIKRAPVVWFATHHNTPSGDAFYSFSYIFQFDYDLPVGVNSVTLPDNSKIRILAMSVSQEWAATPPGAPLYDTLADHQPSGVPLIPQAGQSFSAATKIELVPPLYHQPGDLHYTIDGSDPNAGSPVYAEPFVSENTLNLAVRQINGDGEAGPIVRGMIEIKDQTPPSISVVSMDKNSNELVIAFSKPVDSKTATDTANYVVQPELQIKGIDLLADKQTIRMAFNSPLQPGTNYTIQISGIQDISVNHNAIAQASEPFNVDNVVYNSSGVTMPHQSVSDNVAGLPLQEGDAWTMNLLVSAESMPESKTLIAGFGNASRGGGAGTGRYFAIFDDGIRLWSADRDISTNSPLDLHRWQMLTAAYDGKSLAIYKDAILIKKENVSYSTDSDGAVCIGTPDPWENRRTFPGIVQQFTVRRGALSAGEVKQLFKDTKPSP
jgi:alpha-mannosidase